MLKAYDDQSLFDICTKHCKKAKEAELEKSPDLLNDEDVLDWLNSHVEMLNMESDLVVEVEGGCVNQGMDDGL